MFDVNPKDNWTGKELELEIKKIGGDAIGGFVHDIQSAASCAIIDIFDNPSDLIGIKLTKIFKLQIALAKIKKAFENGAETAIIKKSNPLVAGSNYLVSIRNADKFGVDAPV